MEQLINDEIISNKDYLYKVLLEEVNTKNTNKLKDFKKVLRLKKINIWWNKNYRGFKMAIIQTKGIWYCF